MNKWISPVIFSLAAVIMSLIVYNDLPDNMAIHFGSSGEADNFASKPVGAFLAPVIIWFVSIITNLAMKTEKDESKRQRAEAVNAPILAVVGALLLAVHLFTIAHNLGRELNASIFSTVAVGLLFVFIGNLVPRMAQTQATWKWPVLSDIAQRQYRRFVGRLMFAVGFVFILLALLPHALIFPVFLALLALFIAATFGSLYYFSRVG